MSFYLMEVKATVAMGIPLKRFSLSKLNSKPESHASPQPTPTIESGNIKSLSPFSNLLLDVK